MAKFPCLDGCNCGGCIGECYDDGCPTDAPCRPCYDQWDDDAYYRLVPVTDGQSEASEPAEQGPGDTDPIVAERGTQWTT